ncbi:MAG: WbqC family protein [Lachnospiraceae bacterium]|nr:WbqC family protein [Lachnospiraceae bacterium]
MKKRVGIMQPYFMPYLGYWQHMASTDEYVLYDDVNYIKKGWINRNRILALGKEKMFTIPLSRASQNRKINSIYLANDAYKENLYKDLYHSYHKCSMWNSVNQLMESIIFYEDKHLVSYILNSITVIADYLDIDTHIILSSNIEKDNELKGQDKILSICKNLNASTYINPSGGFYLYDEELFLDNGIELKFIVPEFPKYSQEAKDFIPGLSIIDLLFNVNKKELKDMLNKYQLKRKCDIEIGEINE